MRRILLIAGAILLVGLVALAMLSRREDDGENRKSVNGTLTNSDGTNSTPETTNTNATVPSSRTEILKVSRIFSERYASTSSDDPTGNLRAAEAYTSKALASTFERLIAAWPKTSTQSESTTSRAYAFSVRSLDEQQGRADVTVTLKRTERIGEKNPVAYNQDLALQFIREGGAWKVNAATFVPRN